MEGTFIDIAQFERENIQGASFPLTKLQFSQIRNKSSQT